MTLRDNHVELTQQAFHRKPFQKNLRTGWFFFASYLSALWVSKAVAHFGSDNRCFVKRTGSDNYELVTDVT